MIFLLAILVPASSSPAFHTMYPTYKLNKWGYNIYPWCIPFPIWNQSIVPCVVLTCLLTCIQVSQETDKVVWYSHLFKNFVVCYDPLSQRLSRGQWNRSRFFLEFLCFFYDPMDIRSMISGSSAFLKSSLYICRFSVHVLLKSSLKDFEHYLASMWNEHSCTKYEHSLGLPFLGIGMKTDLSQSCGHCWVFKIC